MKKLFLSIFVAGLLLSGCSDSNSNKLYLKCKTIKAGTFVTGDYGMKIDEIKYFEIDLKTNTEMSRNVSNVFESCSNIFRACLKMFQLTLQNVFAIVSKCLFKKLT